MDIARPNRSRRPRILFAFVVMIILAGITFLLANLKPRPDVIVTIQDGEEVTYNKHFGYKVTEVGRINGYISYIIEDDFGGRFLVFRDNVIPIKTKP